jgi:hypothetical protein
MAQPAKAHMAQLLDTMRSLFDGLERDVSGLVLEMRADNRADLCMVDRTGRVGHVIKRYDWDGSKWIEVE